MLTKTKKKKLRIFEFLPRGSLILPAQSCHIVWNPKINNSNSFWLYIIYWRSRWYTSYGWEEKNNFGKWSWLVVKSWLARQHIILSYTIKSRCFINISCVCLWVMFFSLLVVSLPNQYHVPDYVRDTDASRRYFAVLSPFDLELFKIPFFFGGGGHF